ncbi:MAG: DUF3617 domain-containing protein [Steroidobacteraceae bacterium]
MTIRGFLGIAGILVSIATARSDEIQLPLLKEGLVESHTQMIFAKNKIESVMKLCSTHELDKSMKSAGESVRKRNHCTEVTTRLSVNSFSSEMHCDKDGSVTKTTITYQGDTSSHVEQHTTTGQSESVTIIDQRYLGSCPSDMKPGDAVMADGKKISLGAP